MRVVLVLVLAWFCLRVFERFGEKTLRITFFDVGQGDAALVRFPGAGTLLVDAGDKVPLAPDLARLGILTLDVFLLTHPDQDHGGGLAGLLDGLTVGRVWINTAFLRTLPHKPLVTSTIRTAAAHATPLEAVDGPRAGDWAGVRWKLLPLVAGDTTNERALLLTLEYGGCRIFFAADIGEKGEKEWLARAPESAFLLKVGHHGSRFSSHPPFLRKLRPRYGVVSSGAGNRYGHPTAEALARIRAAGATVLRTDFHGAVTFTFSADGRFRCRTVEGDCGEGRCD